MYYTCSEDHYSFADLCFLLVNNRSMYFMHCCFCKKLIFQLLMVLSKIKMCNLKLCKNAAHKKILHSMGIKKSHILKVGGMF